ncbi:MAG: hypothetical protein ABW033_01485 [Acidimicrobiia bacterium]
MPRPRLLFVVPVIGALASLGALTGAGAQEVPTLLAPLTIQKVVSGPVPAGTTFTVTLTCPEGNIDSGTHESEDGLSEATVTFNAAGNALGDNVFGFVGEGTCTVHETATGGATTVSYACVGDFNEVEELPDPPTKDDVSAAGLEATTPCGTVGADGVQVFIEEEGQVAAVTVTNGFVAPAAEAVVAAPAFTG